MREPRPIAAYPPLLRASGLQAAYGAATVLRDIDFEVGAGELVAVLGANGAGKTTLARTLSGISPTRAGIIEFDGADVTGVPAFQRARAGISHCQEGRKLFAEQTVRENLLLGAHTPGARNAASERMAWVHELFPVLAERHEQLAGTLSGGQQQMLAIGRALMAQPRLLLCDEISLGLAPVAIDALYEAIAQIVAEGLSVVLVEQNVHRSLEQANRVYVLERGRVTFTGAPHELADDERLLAAYFGARPDGSTKEERSA